MTNATSQAPRVDPTLATASHKACAGLPLEDAAKRLLDRQHEPPLLRIPTATKSRT